MEAQNLVLQLGYEVEETLVITITYTDGMSKTKVLSVGDFVSIAYNKNGCRRTVNGTVTNIHANPYNPKMSKKEWYIIVSSDEFDEGFAGAVKIYVPNILDVNVIRQKNFVSNVTTPNNSMRVTSIRVKYDTLQISTNGGRTWKSVGTLTDDLIGPEIDIDNEVRALIGSDQYSNSDEFVRGIVDIINKEVKRITKNHCCCEVSDEEDTNTN